MRILWWSNSPAAPTGYGVQTALFAPRIRDLGHEVAIGAFYGLQGAPSEWNGIPIYPGGRENWGLDVLEGHYQHWQADVAITLMDTWCLNPLQFAGLKDTIRLACWTPVDCKPLSVADQAALEAAESVPIAVSRHGERMMRQAGLDPVYVPHAVDTTLFRPPDDRDELRRQLGIHDRFVIGINAANNDHSRKGFPEQFRAFAAFAKSCPEALLRVHAIPNNGDYSGLDLYRLADACGIREDQIQFADEHKYLTSLYSQEQLAGWYGSLDVLSCCSWGEGFGIPIIEAQACGTPAIVTNASAMTELRGPGWQVDGEPFWHVLHEAWWVKPSVPEIAHAYKLATVADRRQAARDFALAYDAKTVLEQHWVPALERIASTLPDPTAPARAGSPGPR